jgi:hypothetical protein
MSHVVWVQERGRTDVRDLLPYPLHVPNLSLCAQLALGPDFPGNLLDLCSEDGQLVDHVIDRVHDVEHFSGNGYTSDYSSRR